MNPSLIFLVLVSVLLQCGCHSHISGIYVHDDMGRPISDASIRYIDYTSTPLIHLKTNFRGEAKISVNIPPLSGMYDLSISKAGYGPVNVSNASHLKMGIWHVEKTILNVEMHTLTIEQIKDGLDRLPWEKNK